MNKALLSQAIADKIGTSKKEAEDMVEAFTEIVTETIKSGAVVNIAGFGAFSARTRAGRVGVNPQNPSEKIDIPPVTVPKFKAGKRLKDALKAKPEAETTEDTSFGEMPSETPVEPVNEPTSEPTNEPEQPTNYYGSDDDRNDSYMM